MILRELQIRVGLFCLSMLSLLWGFHLLLLSHAPAIFQAVEEDLSYGWYVPLFSLYILWREWKEIAASVGEPSILGFLLAIPFFLLGLLGARGLQIRFEMLAFAGLCWTLPWAFFGRRLAMRVLFPAAFLLFCLPLATFLDVITVHLRLFATSVAYGALKGFGVDVVRRGTMLMSSTGSFAIDVAEPCSGLRSIFALMALTAGYAYFSQRTWLRRGVLFACSIPIAIFGNVMRILTIVLVAATCSPDFATGFYHDYSGYVVFFAAILLMLLASRLIAAKGEK